MLDDIKSYMVSKSLENYIITNKNITLKSLINSLFTFEITKNINCPLCGNSSESSDNINNLYLSIYNTKLNLYDLISNYMFETLDSANKYKCDKCNNLVNATIERKINKVPKYLIITLKRYSNQNNKINDYVNMYEKCTINNKNYELRGIVYHSGSTQGGHYVYYGNTNNKWYLYNDSNVSDIDNIDNIIGLGYIYLYVSK